MSTPKHTPGPWVLDYDKGSTRDILSLKHGGICTVRRAGRHNNETFSANARLIVSAPDLFACIEDIKSRVVLLRCDLAIDKVSHDDHMRRLFEIADLAFKALEKAEGKE